MAASTSDSNGKKDFQWTDDEAELLLNCTHLYKVKKEMASVDWESVKSKVSEFLKDSYSG